MIFSTGYGKKSFLQVVGELKKAEIQYLVDIRTIPYSRFYPDFCKESMSRLLARNGIKYVFMGDDLGGRPGDDDCYTDGKVDYDKCRTKDFFRRGINRLKSAHAQGFRVCLLCSEAYPWECHRSKLVGAALLDEGIEVLHILPDGTTLPQGEVILRAGEASSSRKKYR